MLAQRFRQFDLASCRHEVGGVDRWQAGITGECIGALRNQQHMAAVIHQGACATNRASGVPNTADRAASPRSTVHDRRVEFRASVAVQRRTDTGVEIRGLLEEFDDLGHHVEGAAAAGEEIGADACDLTQGLPLVQSLAAIRPGAAVQGETDERGSGHLRLTAPRPPPFPRNRSGISGSKKATYGKRRASRRQNRRSMTNRRKISRSTTGKHGHLVIIGGGEDRTGGKQILKRFIELSGGEKSRIAVLTAASTEPDEVWKVYDRAFGELGIRERIEVAIPSREAADGDPALETLKGVDAVFITGGDQKRLLALLGGTKLDFALHDAFTTRGICIGGTSAGASAMSEHMLAEGKADDHHPHKGMALLAAGFGFLPRVIVDQHFSQRRRLVRLLSAVAQNPYLLGAGIDEDTALVIRRNSGIEVVGEGAVTLVDGRHMISNILEVDQDEHLEMLNVRLHLLPAGCTYYQEEHKGKDARPLPEPLMEAIAILGAVS